MTTEQVATFLQRIDKLTSNHKGSFGAMNVNQMVCHCTDQLRIAMGKITLGDQGVFNLREIIDSARAGHSVLTPKGLGQVEGDGTSPTTFEHDKETLRNYILDFSKLPNDFDYYPHPYFGKIDRNQWTNLVIYHLNHHLKQFNV